MPQKIPPELLDTETLSTLRDPNPIINGDMRIDTRQGGASIAVTSASVFVVDRWRSGMSGANGTGQQVACSLTGFPKMVRLTGAAGTTSAWHGQYIESFDMAPHVGKRVTVQVRAASSTVTSLTVNLKTPTATDNYTSTTTVETKTLTISPTLAYYELTFDNALPAGVVNGLYLEFVTTTSLGAGTFDITGVQIDFADMATPYRAELYGDALARCQRFYYKANAYPLGVTLNVTDGYASTVKLPQPMRANPVLDSGAAYTVGSGSAGTPQVGTVNGECVLMRNSAANWSANTPITFTGGFSAEIS